MAQTEKTAADYFVHSLPGAPDGPLLKMHAGYGPSTNASNFTVLINISITLDTLKSTKSIRAAFSFGITRIDILRIGNVQ